MIFIQMKTKALTLLLICLSVPALLAENAAKSPIRLAAEDTERLLTALRDGDLEKFVVNSTPEFSQTMTASVFSEARLKLLPILDHPSQLDFLGSLNKSASTFYLYRLRPEGTGVDSLVTTAISNGKVAGFLVN